MGADIYTRGATNFGGAFDSNSAAIAFGTLDVALVQTVSFQHNYAAQRQYEIGAFQQDGTATSNVYYLTGRTSGMANLSRILGPPVAIKAFYDKYGDVCNVANSQDNNDLNLRFQRGCGPAGATVSQTAAAAAQAANLTNYLCKYALLTSVQISVQAGEITMFSDQMGLMFTGMNLQSA